MSEFLAWKKSNDRYFDIGDASSESFQRPWPRDSPIDLVETSYFGFSVPEARVHAEIYHWAHPMCGLTSGGIFITQGITSNSMDAAYANWMNYMPLSDDMTNCTYANGITVRMIRPLEEWQISFDDVAASTSLRLTITAVMPPAFRPIGGHFTQAVRTSGELVLRGRPYRIDGLSTRDRAWGDPRPERIIDVPPVGWRVMAFSDDLAFHDLSFESPELNPTPGTRRHRVIRRDTNLGPS